MKKTAPRRWLSLRGLKKILVFGLSALAWLSAALFTRPPRNEEKISSFGGEVSETLRNKGSTAQGFCEQVEGIHFGMGETAHPNGDESRRSHHV